MRNFVASLWRHDGSDGWHFLRLPEDLCEEIREMASGNPRPFGTIAAVATIGATTWSTSLFADRKLNSHVLPKKAGGAAASSSATRECSIELAE